MRGASKIRACLKLTKIQMSEERKLNMNALLPEKPENIKELIGNAVSP